MQKNIPNWDLTDFYKNTKDPKIKKDQKEIESLSISFIKNYKDKINSKKLTSEFLLKALKDYEKILEKLSLLENYAGYWFSTNSKLPKISKFYQQINEFSVNINTQLLWFELELTKLDNNITLESYNHYLTKIRSFKAFTLTESEEKIMTLKAQTSGQAFIRLYDQTESTNKYEIEINSKKQIMNGSEIGSIMKGNPNRIIRQKAIESYSKGNDKNSDLYTYILNTLILDKKMTDEIRGFNFAEQSTYLNYEVNSNMVESMSNTVSSNVKLVEDFYIAKRKLLKLKKLDESDRYSSIFNLKTKTYSFQETKDIILSCFEAFDPQFKEIAQLFFDNNWIDATVKDGKRSGAYCSYGTPSTHPLILVNFSGKIEDITTLAHELGHGIHAYLSKSQNLLQFHSSTATAEIASTFAESLVFEKLFNETNDKKEKINLLGGKIQNGFATIFRQNDFFVFEKELHKLRRTKGELNKDEIGNLYQEILQKTFGSGLTLSPLHKNFWMPIGHFYHYNFYVFTYVFGDLLATSLFAKYKKEGNKFIGKYTNALSLGGSMSPTEITKVMGVDLNQKDFWQNGINLIKNEIESFERLSGTL